MFNKAYAYYLVFSRILIYRLTDWGRGDFWAWLYLRLYDPDSADFQNEIIAKYLFMDALTDEQHYRVAKIFRDFQDKIEPKLSPEHHKQVVYSLFVAEAWEGSEGSPLPILNDS